MLEEDCLVIQHFLCTQIKVLEVLWLLSHGRVLHSSYVASHYIFLSDSYIISRNRINIFLIKYLKRPLFKVKNIIT